MKLQNFFSLTNLPYQSPLSGIRACSCTTAGTACGRQFAPWPARLWPVPLRDADAPKKVKVQRSENHFSRKKFSHLISKGQARAACRQAQANALKIFEIFYFSPIRKKMITIFWELWHNLLLLQHCVALCGRRLLFQRDRQVVIKEFARVARRALHALANVSEAMA